MHVFGKNPILKQGKIHKFGVKITKTIQFHAKNWSTN